MGERIFQKIQSSAGPIRVDSVYKGNLDVEEVNRMLLRFEEISCAAKLKTRVTSRWRFLLLSENQFRAMVPKNGRVRLIVFQTGEPIDTENFLVDTIKFLEPSNGGGAHETSLSGIPGRWCVDRQVAMVHGTNKVIELRDPFVHP